MGKVMITGVNGFTGRYLCQRLMADGHEVHGLVRPSDHDGTDTSALTQHQVGLDDRPALTRLFEQVQPDHIVHLAAISFVASENIDEIYTSNLLASRNLLQALADSRVAVQNVLLASSANIYGNRQAGRIVETMAAAPANDYGISKLAMELVARLFDDVLPITIVRPFNYTGIGQSSSFVIPKIVDHIKRRASRIELGNMNVERDFSDVRGVVDCYARILRNERTIGQTFNVCSGEPHSLNAVIAIAKEISGVDLAVDVNPHFTRRHEIETLYGSADRLQSVIGPIGMPPLSATLRWMIEG